MLIKLKSLQNNSYDLQYQKKAMGFIYSLLKNTPLQNLHNQKAPKMFCFSNIFPIGDIKEGDIRNLIISSPDNIFLQLLKYKIEQLDRIRIGEYVFKLEEIKFIKTNLKEEENIKLKTATPIIVRIPLKNNYNINSDRIEYWRIEHPISCFLNQLEENIYKKYKNYYSKDVKKIQLFEKLKFIKTVAIKIPIQRNKDTTMIGSLWEFEFENLNKEKKEILEFGIDAGFGEKNSYGFGFVNKI
ncbi:MAG: CRISPR-associated endoribonuclease Cas6 [Candidatus Anstonellaceae archaeon]